VLDEKQLTDDLRDRFRGALHFDRLSRGRYATDASLFHVEPLAVAVPEDAESVSELVRYCHGHNVPLIPRGAGTGLAGESLGPAVVLDLSAHFRRVLRVGAGTVTVQAGVVLADLNAELAKYGRRFAPDPASAKTCTVGGMIATNASGGNAFAHGYTRDHVAALGVVWDSGEPGVVGRAEAIGPPTPRPDAPRTRAIATAVAALLRANAERVALTRPRTPFDRCGYQLHGALGAGGEVDLARLLVGSEGTLAVVTEATLRTVPVAGGTSVALLGFPTLEAAVRAGLALRAHHPVSADLLDRRLVGSTRAAGLPSVGAALVVSFEADTEREALERAWGAVEALRREHILRVLAEPTCDPAGVAEVWAARAAAVSGLLSAGGPRPLALVEDVGVPADAVPEFLGRVQEVLRRFEVSASFLIHVLTGQVHARPLLNSDEPADRSKMWPLAEAVHALALELGGTVSSQHGTGLLRTPWVERQYGPLFPVFRELKRVFDPKGVLNPGKIVGPDPSREAWPLRGDREPGTRESEGNGARVPLLVWKGAPEAETARCHGCGDCRTRATPARMCPAFRATGEEADSPRGMLNALGAGEGVTPDELRAAAGRCLNCKQCRDECPSKVDVPKLMLEAKARHHAEHGLDRADWFLARAEGFAALGSNFAPLVNVLLARRGPRWLAEKVFGLSRKRRLPSFALRNFFRRARGLGLHRKRARGDAPRAALFVDVFAAYNDPLIGEAAVAVLQHNGIDVYVPPRQRGSGAAALAQGDLDAARDTAVRNVRALADLTREGFRIVCLEPTSALMLTQDYLALLDDPDARAVASHTVELMVYLGELRTAGKLRTDFKRLDLALGHHVPCHQKALRGAIRGPDLLELIPGVRVHTVDAGCSGMGGTWGLRADRYADSLAAGRAVFAELDRPRVLLGSTECSACRIQMQEGTGKRTLHPVQYLAYAYGLLPDLDARLSKPLGRLVSD
jgi:FAD/FMN-containing dehydrogenase/Fe-S oxidoreductase